MNCNRLQFMSKALSKLAATRQGSSFPTLQSMPMFPLQHSRSGSVALLFRILLWSSFILEIVDAAHNETVDDTSPQITYTGTWLKSTDQSTRYNSTTHYTKTQGDYATFTFTGATHLYYMGYGLLADQVDNTSMDIVFDGTTFSVNEATSSDGRAQAILWSIDSLDPATTHTVVCRKSSASDSVDDRTDVNIDAFILTIPDQGDVVPGTQSTAILFSNALASASPITAQTVSPGPSSRASSANMPLIITTFTSVLSAGAIISLTASPSSSSNSSLASNSQKSSSHNIAAIVGATLGGISVVVAIAAFFFFLGRGRRRAEQRRGVPFEAPPAIPPTSVNPPPSTNPKSEVQTKTRKSRPMSSASISGMLYTSLGSRMSWPTEPPAYSPASSRPLPLPPSPSSYLLPSSPRPMPLAFQPVVDAKSPL